MYSTKNKNKENLPIFFWYLPIFELQGKINVKVREFLLAYWL